MIMYTQYYTCEQLISTDIHYLAFVSNVGEYSFKHVCYHMYVFRPENISVLLHFLLIQLCTSVCIITKKK